MPTIKENVQLIKELLCFVEAGKTGKINKTASNHGYKQSNFSNLIKQLEHDLRTQLVSRLSTGIVLTESGKDIFEIACQIESILRQVANYSKQSRTKGNVRLWIGDGLASGYISSCLPEFYLKYPDISIDMKCSLETPEIIDKSDIVIIYNQPAKNSKYNISKHVLHFGLFASQEYLSNYGYPKNIADLCKNHLICTRNIFANIWPQWQKVIKSADKIVLQTNSAPVLAQVIKEGLGIGLLPKTGYGDGLVELTKLKLNIEHPFWIIYHKENSDASIKALANHIIETTKNL